MVSSPAPGLAGLIGGGSGRGSGGGGGQGLPEMVLQAIIVVRGGLVLFWLLLCSPWSSLWCVDVFLVRFVSMGTRRGRARA